MDGIAYRFDFLQGPEEQDWARDVFARDRLLRRSERSRLDLAMDYPDLFERAPYDHILYKALRRSDDAAARALAGDLRRNISRFDRFERFWQVREARKPREIRPAAPAVVQLPVLPFRHSCLRPAPAAAMGILISALTMAH